MSPAPELADLANRYADGQADAQQVATLARALHDDPAFRRWFVRFLHVDAALSGRPQATTAWPPPAADSGAAWLATHLPPRNASWWWRAGTTAAAALLLILVGTWLSSARDALGAAPAVSLIASSNAQWADPEIELALRAGDLPGGLLRLEAGSAEFRFAHGATAVLLGPAEVRFTGANDLYVEHGQVLCRCPTPESRITLTTPTTRVVDLGTEFAVAVAPDTSATQVAVISGAVEVGTVTTTVLRTGQSAEIRRDRVLALTPLPDTTFTRLLSSAAAPTTATGPNLLTDAAFSGTPAHAWRLTDGHASIDAGAGELVISARGHRFWPSARQAVRQALGEGQVVSASVRAYGSADDPLQERQSAILKLVFIDDHGREFAQASRHFLFAGRPAAGQPVECQVAAAAPAGTRGVEFQLLLNARGRSGGTVRFSRPSLVVMPDGPSR
jgi:hypothetical protein